MFVRSASDVSICLRCQVRLASGRTTTALQRQWTPNIVQATRLSSTDAAPEQPPPRRSSRSYRPYRTFYPGGGVRRHRGGSVREASAPLEIDSLGKPSEVIIFRDAKLGPRRKRPFSVESDEKYLSGTDLLDSIEAERGLVGEDGVRRNIERNRPPTSSRLIPKTTFNEILKSLQDGFTSSQLLQYINLFPPPLDETQSEGVRDKEKPEKKEEARTKILEMSNWTLGERPFLSYPFDIPTASDDSKTKAALATRILRKLWKVEIREEIESIGELYLRLQSSDLAMLLGERRGYLKKFAERRNAKIDVSRSGGLLRVTADKENSLLVARDIETTLKRVRQMELDLTPLQSVLKKDEPLGYHTFSELTKKMVSEITGTLIEDVPGTQKLDIYYFDSNANDADDARRLLLSSVQSDLNCQQQLLWHGKHERLRGILVPEPPHVNLPWNDRQKVWSRWSYATTKEEPAAETQDAQTRPPGEDLIPETIVSKLEKTHASAPIPIGSQTPENADIKFDDTLTESFEQSKTGQNATQQENSFSIARWESQITRETFALIGKIIHETPRLIDPQPCPAEKISETGSARRPLSGSFLATQNLLQELNVGIPLTAEFIKIRLIPSPWSERGGNLFQNIPSIEIVLSIPVTTEQPQVQSIRAIIGERVSDLLLPQRPGDARFITRSYVELANPGTDKQFQRFLNESSLNIRGKERLRTPSALTVSLPNWLIQDTNSEKRSEPASTQQTEVDYLFGGLDYRESIHFPFEGWNASYTSIEAGKFGGRRGELRLSMEKSSDIPSVTDAVEQEHTDISASADQPEATAVPAFEKGAQVVQNDTHIDFGRFVQAAYSAVILFDKDYKYEDRQPDTQHLSQSANGTDEEMAENKEAHHDAQMASPTA
ncbi:hypothetical protein L228DRAFT_261382 [Xylona heveae TC161]|uniref:Mitochondrial inner-membrane-bound regulator-domain-containing protein n=1 Tax=Xylona heveae (strain CBS 132557 / TC161) TaxID=1328760 RepID=A0A165GGY2_XYLHT|nr:hypothetical protein L228DRAFT_261382 [Xylona heveae TC161]KZF22173.1 hypothetical protein L228DRAFT_261382 [Xylona heveae TC161]